MSSVDITIQYKEKLPYRDVARVYGQMDVTKVGGGTVSIAAKDFDLKTLRAIQITPTEVAMGNGIGSIDVRGSVGNSVTFVGSVSNFEFVVLGE